MNASELPIVDGKSLEEEVRNLLLPGEEWCDAILPRSFYSVATWDDARQTCLSPHFKLSELMAVDCREDERLLNEFPHYAPCKLSLLALALETFRREVRGPVYIATNGGYRSPAHRLAKEDPIHSFGLAADIYRIDSNYLDNKKTISRFARLAESLSPIIRAAPYRPGDDHLHFEVLPLQLEPMG